MTLSPNPAIFNLPLWFPLSSKDGGPKKSKSLRETNICHLSSQPLCFPPSLPHSLLSFSQDVQYFGFAQEMKEKGRKLNI